MKGKNKLDTESYKGVRDFYPEDMAIQKHIFSIWRKVVESFGYNEYGASVLEPAELYKEKSGEEIVNEQTYTFTDRGEREVTLRPEMTPTVARMVSGKVHNLVFPLRWYSIPNLFRYEKPQRGRLREHWQLNVDLFGVEGSEADTEIINIAYKIMREFGASDDDFVIKINSRKLIDNLFDYFEFSIEQRQKLSKIMDKRSKISDDIFETSVEELIGKKKNDFIPIIISGEKIMEKLGNKNENVSEVIELIEKLQSIGVKNIVFDPMLMRGFDYYTGIVFEVYDTNPNNNRALFGGGRYDNLSELFGVKSIPAFGFGMGDVTARDFLETRNLLPKYNPSAKIYMCVLDKKYLDQARILADKLRQQNINTLIDLSGKKVGEQTKLAHRQMIPYTLYVGENEIKTGLYSIKEMSSGKEMKLKIEEIPNFVS